MVDREAITDLTRRALRHGWRLTEDAGELVLLGNGHPAAWRSVAAAVAWFDAQEKTKPSTAQMELWQEAA